MKKKVSIKRKGPSRRKFPSRGRVHQEGSSHQEEGSIKTRVPIKRNGSFRKEVPIKRTGPPDPRLCRWRRPTRRPPRHSAPQGVLSPVGPSTNIDHTEH